MKNKTKQRLIEKKAKRLFEFIKTLQVGREISSKLFGVDGNLLRYYLHKIINGENVEVEYLLKHFIPVERTLSQLGYRYKELAKDIKDIIEYYEK